ncbi:MAG: hypothetical protein SFX18_09110 [Pirellulales bacterium]|nr:hypothetical protein [Pirellulales bacterium]
MWKSLLMVGCMALGMVGYAVFADKAEKPKDPLAAAKCPASNEGVSADQAVEFEGGMVYFCCEKCKAAFEKDSAKMAAKSRHQMVVTGQFEQKACPLSGGPTKAETAIDVAGTKVAFCCENCQGKAKKAGDDVAEVLFGDKEKFAKAFAKVEKKAEK